jgi:AcrR family transcriptional regulator
MATIEPAAQAPPTQAPRLYRGLSAAQRRAQRREQLLEAGLELFGTQGYAATSIRAVSAAASLNSRYFYESFSSREDLLWHVYLGIIRESMTAVIEATAGAQTLEEQARAGLRASWKVFTDDPRKARVLALEVIGVSDRLEQMRRESRHAFADVLMRNGRSFVGESVALRMDPLLTARALMGAHVQVLADWVHGDVDASVEEIVEHFTMMYTAVAYASVESPPVPKSSRESTRSAR